MVSQDRCVLLWYIRGLTDTPTDLCALLGDLRGCGKSHAQVCTQMVSQDRCVLLWYIRGLTDTPTDLFALLGDLRGRGKSHAQVCTQMVSQDRCVLLWYIRGLTLLQTCVPYWVILGGVARAMPRFVPRWSLRTGVFYCGILEAWHSYRPVCLTGWS